ncbi:twin-arginine translocase subunit TatC [Candidatus Woesebacteria bacterium]|nr:twin-arginine translocase subunit TatC [Candidatus Woesebacteria bacterium]
MEKIQSYNPPDLGGLFEKYSPYFKEARRRLLTTLVVFALSTIAGFIFYEDIIRFFVGTLSLEGVNIVFTSPFQFINLAFSCGVVTGLVIALPLFVFQILHFLKPALNFKEYKTILRFLPFSLILFLMGFTFGAVIMRWQIEIFLERSISLGIGNILDISGLLSIVLLTCALMGAGFQFPIVLLLLLRLGIIKHHHISSKRKWFYLGSFIFVMFLPPDSILTNIILTLPFIFLFEITLILDLIFNRERRKK